MGTDNYEGQPRRVMLRRAQHLYCVMLSVAKHLYRAMLIAYLPQMLRCAQHDTSGSAFMTG